VEPPPLASSLRPGVLWVKTGTKIYTGKLVNVQ
jgi:hypothetical protein